MLLYRNLQNRLKLACLDIQVQILRNRMGAQVVQPWQHSLCWRATCTEPRRWSDRYSTPCPDCQGDRYISFRKSHNIYFLGVVLLEIGCVDSFWDRVGSMNGMVRRHTKWRTCWSKQPMSFKLPLSQSSLRQLCYICLTFPFGRVIDEQRQGEKLKYFTIRITETLHFYFSDIIVTCQLPWNRECVNFIIYTTWYI